MSTCARCGALGETKQVTVLQVMGLLFLVRFRTTGGQWCRPCIVDELGPASIVTAAIGWLSPIGIVVAPVFLALNLATYIRTRGMQPPTSAPPSLAPEAPTYGAPPPYESPGGFGAQAGGFGAPYGGPQAGGFGPQAHDAPRRVAATMAMTTPLAPSGFAPSPPPPAAPGNGLAIGVGLMGAAVAGIGALLVAFFGYLWAFGTTPGDQQFSPLCLGMSFVACVLPGMAGLGYSLFRVLGRTNALGRQ